MPDAPDYSKYLPGSARFSLQDLGELAARMKSPDVFDRRGEVLWIDDLRSGLAPYVVAVSGTGGDVQITAGAAHHGSYALKMVGGSDASLTAQVTKTFAHIAIPRMGVEMAFNMNSLCDNFRVSIARYDGVNVKRGRIALYPQTNQLKYLNSAGVDTVFATVGASVDAFQVWQHLKLVIDLSTSKYVRALYNDQEYDLSAHALYNPAAADIPQDRITVTLVSRAGNNDVGLVSHLIVTGNEP